MFTKSKTAIEKCHYVKRVFLKTKKLLHGSSTDSEESQTKGGMELPDVIWGKALESVESLMFKGEHW